MVTSCGERSRRTRASASVSTPSSWVRPTIGARLAGARSTPNRERASSASHAGTGSALPLAATGSAARYVITWEVARYVVSPTRMPLTGAAVCKGARWC